VFIRVLLGVPQRDAGAARISLVLLLNLVVSSNAASAAGAGGSVLGLDEISALSLN
jgi:hypothetical protein